MVRSPLGAWTTPLVLLALCACNQSLFDENIDDGEPGGVADDGDLGDGGDGGDGGDDGDVGDDDDGGDSVPVPAECPEPCQGDPVEDFSLEQGGTNGRWFYLVDRGEANGADIDQLQAGTYEGADAWLAGSAAGPAIVNCAGNMSASVCAGAGDSLVLLPSGGDSHPTIGFRAPASGTYRVAGQFHTPQGFPAGVAQQFLLSRNARHDLLAKNSFLTQTAESSFSVDVEALAGDQIHLSLLPAASGGGAVAFDFYVTLLGGAGDIFPGRCMFAATFDGGEPFTDLCGGAPLANLNDGVGPADVVTSEGPSVNERFGNARVFGEATYIRSMGSSMDYSGDFTVQLWANPAAQRPSRNGFLYGDAANDAFGGVAFLMRDSVGTQISACYIWNDGSDPPPDPPLENCFDEGSFPDDGDWHFFRLARKDGTISFCIDGLLQGTDTEPGTFDISSNQPPRIGKGVFPPAYYGGSIDDVRIFRRALPCPTVP